MPGCRRLFTLAGVAFALLTAVPDAGASIIYETEAGWFFPGVGNQGSIPHGGSTPQTSFSGDFSFGGALCPAVGTSDYLCANVFAEATNTFEGLTLRASARVVRHDGAVGGSHLTHGTAKITMCNLSGSIATPASIAKFHIGLTGTTSASASDPVILVQAFGVARFQGAPIQCSGTSLCEPVTVPQFDPAGCTSLELRADAAFSSVQNVTGWDGEVVANFADTMTLLAIEGLDENGQPIPGLQFSATDAQGMPIITFPNVVPPSTTTTTTAPGATTTTTIIPGGCAVQATYASVRCRLDALVAAIGASDAGTLAQKLTAKVSAARSAVDRAEQTLGQRKGKPSKAALRKALKSLKAYAKILGSKKARRDIPEATLSALGAPVPGVRSDVRGLPTSSAT